MFTKSLFAELYFKQFIDPVELGEKHIAPLDAVLHKVGVGYVVGNEYDIIGNAVIVIA